METASLIKEEPANGHSVSWLTNLRDPSPAPPSLPSVEGAKYLHLRRVNINLPALRFPSNFLGGICAKQGLRYDLLTVLKGCPASCSAIHALHQPPRPPNVRILKLPFSSLQLSGFYITFGIRFVVAEHKGGSNRLSHSVSPE